MKTGASVGRRLSMEGNFQTFPSNVPVSFCQAVSVYYIVAAKHNGWPAGPSAATISFMFKLLFANIIYRYINQLNYISQVSCLSKISINDIKCLLLLLWLQCFNVKGCTHFYGILILATPHMTDSSLLGLLALTRLLWVSVESMSFSSTVTSISEDMLDPVPTEWNDFKDRDVCNGSWETRRESSDVSVRQLPVSCVWELSELLINNTTKSWHECHRHKTDINTYSIYYQKKTRMGPPIVKFWHL